MREIKFRAWDALNKEMLGINDKPQEFWSKVHPSSCDVYVMQYAGLKDKNGVEIYEGDILIAENDSYPSEIKFDLGGFLASCDFYGDVPLADVAFTERVIGNIYENPELLEDKQS